MNGSPEDLIVGVRYYVHFEVPNADPSKATAAGSFRARFDGMDLGDDKQLYLFFQGGNYVDVRHVKHINAVEEL
jgi:hypothetical protein